MKSGIYRIVNKESGKFYIGKAVNIKYRVNAHVKALEAKKHHCKHLQNAWNKYGKSMFYPEVVIKCYPDECASLEQLLLNVVERKDLYNTSLLSIGGNLDGLSSTDKKEICAKKSEAAKKFYASLSPEEIHELRALCGHRNGMWRKNHSKKTKQGISLTLKAYMAALSPEERRKKFGLKGEANGMFGKKHKESSKVNMRLNGLRGAERTIEQRLGKTAEEIYGKKKATEIRKKISDCAKLRTGSANGMFGKKHSDETVAKISEANKGRLPPNTRKVKINSVVYNSCTEAGKALNVATGTITHRIKSNNPKYKKYYYLT